MAACRVLLADDTDEIRLLLRMALEINGGFEVVAEASDGHQALELTADHRPDAVILDVAMPPMDGLEVIPAIRKVVPDTRILVVSGFNSQHMERAALAAGADAYLEKGVAPEEIVRVLERLCIDHGMGTPVDDSVAKLAHDLLTPVAVIRGFA